MKENDFWDAVMPFIEQEGVLTIANLQSALGLSQEEAESVAVQFCDEHKLFRVVTRDSWGYIRIDPDEEIPQMSRCGGVIPRKKAPSPYKF